jgi:PAS domain S-box-containing protein
MADRKDGVAAAPEFYRFLFEANPQPMWVFDPLSLAFLDVNEAAVSHYGYSRDALLRMKVTDLLAAGEEDAARESLARVMQAAPSGRMTEVGLQRHVRRDGRSVDVEMSWGLVRAGGSVTVLALAHDVTERNFAEQALWASEAQMRGILDTALDAIVLIDSRGLILSWNPRAEALFGWTRQEAVGRRLADLIVPERYREAHTRGLARYLATGEGPMLNRPVELSALRRDGSEFPAALRVSALREVDRVVFCGFVEDITERKQAQDQVARAQRQLAAAQRITHIGSWQWEVGSDQVVWSDELYRIYGLEPQQEPITYAGFLSRVHPDDRERTQANVHAAVAQGGPFAFDERILRPDGSVRVLRSQGEALLDAEGRVTGLLGTCLDVTDRRLEEQRQQQAEERFEKAFRASPAAISISTLREGRFVDVNDAFLRLTRRTRAEVIGHTAVELHVWADAEERARFAEALARDGFVRRTRVRITEGDSERTVLISAELIDLAGERCVLAQSEDFSP